MAGAVSALKSGGLDKVEILRLRSVISGCKAYKELLVDYINYRAIEVKLVALEANYAKLLVSNWDSLQIATAKAYSRN